MTKTETKIEVKGNLLLTECWGNTEDDDDNSFEQLIGEKLKGENIWQDCVLDLNVIKAIKPTLAEFCTGMTCLYNSNCDNFVIKIPYTEFKLFWVEWKMRHD